MKRQNNKGFTLIEMLIVVGIIAILVAVSIPMVNSSLEKTREATDMANERAAIAEAIIMYLSGQMENHIASPDLLMNADAIMYYDAEHGTLIHAGYGDSEIVTPYGQCKDHKNGYLGVVISDGNPYITWYGAHNAIAHLKGRDFILNLEGGPGTSEP